MPQCAFKNCRNNARKSNLSAGVSYFRFPNNPFTCADWVSIVAKERRDGFYKPAKSSVICSEHFDKLDISGNTNRRRLAKTAVPKLQIQPSSEDPQLPPPEDPLLLSATPNTQDAVSSSSSSGLDITHEATFSQDQTNHMMSSSVASLTDLVPVFETPKQKFLNKQILAARKIIVQKSKKIQTLQKVNKRLVKKCSSLKKIVHFLKKKQTIDGTI